MENKVRSQVVDEIGYGAYIWEDTNGNAIVNEDHEYLRVFAKKGDARKILALREVAHQILADNGMPVGGRPRYMDGARPVSNDEWEEQNERMRDGLVPDKYDLGSLIDDYKEAKKKENGGN
jgi:hypothetical protein